MINDYFLNNCLTVCCSFSGNTSKSRDVLQMVYNILEWCKTEYFSSYKKKEELFDVVEKFDLIYYFSKFRCVNTDRKFNLEEFVDKLHNGKYSNFIETIKNKKINETDEKINDLYNFFVGKSKFCELFRGKEKLVKLMNNMESGDYINEDDLIDQWENQVNHIHRNIISYNTKKLINEAAAVDLLHDDYSCLMNKLRQTVDRKEVVPTGFSSIDEELPYGGLEERRLYLIGGTSGVGKSSFLLNLMRKSLNTNRPTTEKKDYYLYITAENLIDESMLRFYCCMTGISVENAIYQIVTDPQFSFKPELVKFQQNSNTNVIFHYMEPRKTKLSELDLLAGRYYDIAEGRLKGIFVDYLDLFTVDDVVNNVDNIRLSHGIISQEFKNMSVRYSCPVVTVTQLNRSGYDKKTEASPTQMSESMYKIDNSDFVLFLQTTQDDVIPLSQPDGVKECKKIKGTIVKNRNGGGVGKTIEFLTPLYFQGKKIFNFRFEERTNLSNKKDDIFEDDFSFEVV